MKKAKIGEGAVGDPGMPLRQVLLLQSMVEISGGQGIRTLVGTGDKCSKILISRHLSTGGIDREGLIGSPSYFMPVLKA